MGSDRLPATVVTGTSVQALMDLSLQSHAEGANPALAEALTPIGDQTGETWLHLLGLCVALDSPRSLAELINHITGMDPMEFRLILLGSTAWSWRAIVGAETIEAAASGDPAASEQLLADDRYYGRSASRALAVVLPLDADDTRRRFLTALEVYRDTTDVERLAEPLAAAATHAESLAKTEGWTEAIEILTDYRYRPEPEARRVVVMPHLGGDGLTLTQHDDARLIVYGQTAPPNAIDQVVDLGKALADPSRVRILALISTQPCQLAEIVEATGLTRSTVHHHLRQLRHAQLISVEGNARAYRYRVNRRGRTQALDAVSDILGT